MQEVTRKKRIAITSEIESILQAHCRPCTVPKKDFLGTCEKCPVFPKLRKLGEQMEGNVPRTAVNRNMWTGKEDRALMRLVRSGMSEKEVAKALNRTPSAIRNRISVFKKRGTALK